MSGLVCVEVERGEMPRGNVLPWDETCRRGRISATLPPEDPAGGPKPEVSLCLALVPIA